MVYAPIYRITNLTPRTDLAVGSFCFGIYLDSKFAQRAIQTEISEETQQRIQENEKEGVIKTMFPNEECIRNPYAFFGNSLLIQSVHVPGNACDLGLLHEVSDRIREGTAGPMSINYAPHNIDSLKQAYSLITLFANWADTAEAILSRQ